MTPPDKPTPDMLAMQLFFGKAVFMATSVVAKLRIADLLAAGPKSAEQLATETTTHAPSLNRVLRALASAGVFTTDAEGRYSLTDVGQFLRTNIPGSIRGIMDYSGAPWSWNAWGDLLHTVKTGETAFNHTYSEGCFDYLAKHPDESEVFNEGMTGFSGVTSKAVVQAYDFTGIQTLVDVGGGHGLLLANILQAYPGMKGIVFDASHVVAGATPALAKEGLTERISVVGGNFFQAVPSGGDAYMMKHIIHDWNDADCTRILGHIREVIPATGKLLIVDMVVPPGDVPHPAKFLDLEMLVIASGKERTEAEFGVLLAGAGFRMTRIVPTPSPVCVVEAVPV